MWISIKDRLPPRRDYVLLFLVDRAIGIGYILDQEYNGRTNWLFQPVESTSFRTTSVTHWGIIPVLPPKPKQRLDVLETRVDEIESVLEKYEKYLSP